MNIEQPLVCPTCNLDYTTWGQYEEHFWSMIHHKQLEIQHGSGKKHLCSLCKVLIDSLPSYAKHLVSDAHRRAIEERKLSKQLQIQQHNQRMMAPRYSQHYQGRWVGESWEMNQREAWPQYVNRNYYSNLSQHRTWSAKADFEVPQKKVTGPHSSSTNSSSQSASSESPTSSSAGINPGGCQTKTPCSVKQPASAGVTKPATCIEKTGHSSGVKSSSKQNTKATTVRITVKAPSKVIIKSKTDRPSVSGSVPKLSSYISSSIVKDRRVSLSFTKSVHSRCTHCKSSGKRDQDKNGKNLNVSSESETTLKYRNREPSTSTPAIGESTRVKKLVSCLKCSKSGDKGRQEKSTDQKKSTSGQEETIQPLGANGRETRTNANSQSNVIKRGTEFGRYFDLKKARRMDMSKTPDGIGKTSASGEIKTSQEKTKKLLDLSEGNMIKEVQENLTSDKTKASTTQASSITQTSGKSSDLNSVALPSSSVDGKSQNTLAVGKTPPAVTRLNLPQSNLELAEKDSMSGGMPSVASPSSEGPLESIELSGEASVTRVQLPLSLQRELTKLLVKSQGPRPRPNLAAARSRLHAGEHHQAQVVESPDRMVQQLLMKLLDSPKSRDRQVQQIEGLQRLLVQASKKGSERARFGVPQLPEISLEVLESLLESGQLKPLLSEDGMESDPNHPVALHASELADSEEQHRRPCLVNSLVNRDHPERGTELVIKQEKVESVTCVKTEPPSPVSNEITIKTEPDLDAAVSTNVASSIQTVVSPPPERSSTLHPKGGSGTDKMIHITDVRSLSSTSKSINPEEVCNLPTEADTQQQPVLPKAPSLSRISEPVLSHPQAISKKVSQKTTRKRRTSPLDLKDILLELSLKEERYHKRLITVESSLRTTRELISKKQKHYKKLKEQRSKISQDVTVIRMKRLQLLKAATTSSLLSPASQKLLTKSCRRQCGRLTGQAACQRSSSGSTPVSGLLSSLTVRSSSSRPVTNPLKVRATSAALTDPYPITNRTQTLCKVSCRGSSIQGQSKGPAGQTLRPGPSFSTEVVACAKPVGKLPQSCAAGSSLQNLIKFRLTSTESTLSRPVNNPVNIQTTSEACTNLYSATNSASTYKISFRESSIQDKSQGPAGRTFFKRPVSSTPVSSTPVSASGSSTRSLPSSSSGSLLKFLAEHPFKIRKAAGSAEKRNNNLASVDKPQQVKLKVEPIASGLSPSCPANSPFKIQAKSVACTNPYPVTNTTPINNSLFRGSSIQGKSQGPAGRTIFQGPVLSTPVSVSGSNPGSLPSSSTGCFSKYFANDPFRIHANASTAGSAEKRKTTSDSVDKPQQFKVKVEPIDPVPSPSCPANGPFMNQAASLAGVNPYPVTSSTPTTNILFRGSSTQDKSLGPAGQTLFQEPVSSTPVSASGSTPGSLSSSSTGSSLSFFANNPVRIHAEAATAGSAKKRHNDLDSVDKPQQVKVKVEPIDPGPSPSCPANGPFINQAASLACINPYPVTSSTPTTNILFRGGSIQDKSLEPAGQTLFQGPVSSTPVSASGSTPGSLSISTTGSSLTLFANDPVRIHAEATTAGSAEKSNFTSTAVKKPQQVKVKVEPIDPGYQDVRGDGVQAASVASPETSLCERAKKIPSSLFGTSTSSITLLETGGQSRGERHIIGDIRTNEQTIQDPRVSPGTKRRERAKKIPSSLFGTSTSSITLLETGGQSRGERQIIGDIRTSEQTIQDPQVSPGTKRRFCRGVSASPASKKARTTEGVKDLLAKAKSPRSNAWCPTRSAVSSDTSSQEVLSAVKKSPQSTSVCEKWMPMLKLHKIGNQDTSPIVKIEKSPSVKTTDEGKGSSTTPDYSVFEISSDSDNSASVEPTTSRGNSSSHIYSKISALKTHSPLPPSAYEHQSIPEPKCGMFKAHRKAVHGMCNVKGRLCTVSADFTARVFNTKDFSCHKSFTNHNSRVNCASSWSYKDTDYLFTGSNDETVRVYNMQTLTCERVICCSSRVMCLLLRWETLYAGLANGHVTVINLKDFSTETMRCKTDVPIECMVTATYKGEACLVIAYSDNTVGVHALGDGKQHVYLKGHTGPVLCLGVLANHVYSGSVDRKVMIHDIKTGLRTKTIKHHGSAVTALIVGTPYLITASLDKKVRLFSAQNGKLGRVIAECPYMISCMIRIKKMLYVGYTTGYAEAIDVKPGTRKCLSVTKKPKKKQTMFNCEWLECGVQVNTCNSSKHLNDYHIRRKKEHKCKWGSCDVVINKALPNAQELLWEHVQAHIAPLPPKSE